MRVRILGQYVPTSLAVLAIVEAMLAFVALYAAVCIRFQIGVGELHALEHTFGPLWPRGAAFSAIVVTCLLAFGLYSSRQRAQLTGIFVRVAAALVVAACTIAAVFYVVKVLQVGRGITGLAVTLTGAALLVSRVVFGRAVDEDIFKRRVLVYGAGAAASAIANLRRSSDRRG
ncbi:MAG TPA: hypothetical protein VK695_07660, partial [Steroidobacteraceae bacterium]|nr:hypothetical protein [Steroidobacteraceae bacterium]